MAQIDNSSISWTRWLTVGLPIPLVVLNAWVIIQVFHYFEPLLTIVILAAVFAFVMNYPVRFLQQQGLPRYYAALTVILLALLSSIALGITLVPTLLEQLTGLVDALPNWLNAASDRLQVVQHWASSHRLPINLNRLIAQFTERLPDQLERFGDETLALTLNAVGSISSLLLTMVLTLYLLLDGQRVWQALFRLLPLQRRDEIGRSLQQDFHRYFIGQAALGLMLTMVMAIGLFILQVPYSLLLALVIGIMSLIPFGDALAYGVISVLLAAQNPALAIRTLIVAIVLDQILDQAIAPRILGQFTGLQPIWVILALLVGTKLFGLPGLLLAVPIASFIGSLLGTPSAPALEASDNGKELEPSITLRSQQS